MRRYLQTATGALGLITFMLLLALGITLVAFATAGHTADKKFQCMIKESVQPWVGLKESFSAPPGDTVARAKALKAINRGISRAENLDRFC